MILRKILWIIGGIISGIGMGLIVLINIIKVICVSIVLVPLGFIISIIESIKNIGKGE